LLWPDIKAYLKSLKQKTSTDSQTGGQPAPPINPPVNPPVSPPVSQPVNPPVNPPVSPPVSQPTAPAKWMFYPGLDSHGYDIGNFRGSLSQMKAKCLSMPNCKGFNDNGWMKYKLTPKSRWISWTNDPNKGFHVATDRVTELPEGGVPQS